MRDDDRFALRSLRDQRPVPGRAYIGFWKYVDDIPTCPRCKSVLGDTSKFGDELQTLKCTNYTCTYGRVRVRPK